MSKFKVLEVINAFLGLYIITAYAVYWYSGSLPAFFIYLTPVLGTLLIAYHIKMSSDLKKSIIGSGSLLNLRFVSSAGFTLLLFVLAILSFFLGCLFSQPVAFVFALLFVLDHALYISIDKNQINPKSRNNTGTPLLAAA